MLTGAKLDRNSARSVGGVMGVCMSLRPKNIPLIQEWLKNARIGHPLFRKQEISLYASLLTRSLLFLLDKHEKHSIYSCV